MSSHFDSKGGGQNENAQENVTQTVIETAAFSPARAIYDLKRIGKYKEVLPLFEQSLSISREIGDKNQ